MGNFSRRYLVVFQVLGLINNQVTVSLMALTRPSYQPGSQFPVVFIYINIYMLYRNHFIIAPNKTTL